MSSIGKSNLEKTGVDPLTRIPGDGSSSSTSVSRAPPQVPPSITHELNERRFLRNLPEFKGSNWYGYAKRFEAYAQFTKRLRCLEGPCPGLPLAAKSIIDMKENDPFRRRSNSILSSGESVYDPQELPAGSLTPEQELYMEDSMILYLDCIGTLKCEEAIALTYDIPNGNMFALWERLRSHYEKRNQATHSRLMTEFFTIRQHPNENVEQYVARIRTLVLKLQQASPNENAIDHSMIKFRFLAGLSPAFDHARAALEASRDYISMDFNEAADYMVSQSSFMQLRRLERQSYGNQREDKQHANVNYAAQKNKQKNDGDGDQNDAAKPGKKRKQNGKKCTWCHKPNHTEDVCYSKRWQTTSHRADCHN